MTTQPPAFTPQDFKNAYDSATKCETIEDVLAWFKKYSKITNSSLQQCAKGCGDNLLDALAKSQVEIYHLCKQSNVENHNPLQLPEGSVVRAVYERNEELLAAHRIQKGD